VGAGVGPTDISEVWGIAKAYSTRVGAGPFPTELHDEIGEQIIEQGHEYGTTTGRKRRAGWMDLVGLRYAVRLEPDGRPGDHQARRLERDRPHCGSRSATAPRRARSWRSFPYHQSILHSATAEYEELPGFDVDPHRLPHRRGLADRGARLPRLHRRVRRGAGEPRRRRARPRQVVWLD